MKRSRPEIACQRKPKMVLKQQHVSMLFPIRGLLEHIKIGIIKLISSCVASDKSISKSIPSK